MLGINLKTAVVSTYASLRYFAKNECHVDRFSKDNVLLLVFDGVLRFSEDDAEQEVRAGEYYIQRKNCYQAGRIASDAPKYLYVHFLAEWTDTPDALPYRGEFNYELLADLMKSIDTAYHEKYPYVKQQYLFLKLLLSLQQTPSKNTAAQNIAQYIEKNIKNISSLSELCKVFHYSKNYIILIFRKEFGVSPISYINAIKIKRAMYLLETTSESIESISSKCGYNNYSHFYRLFLKQTGKSPYKWRKQIQQYPFWEE
ncbi:MAG: helix-turn-helix transcriptional regulator [Clostridia bacterium]|nr:helix-turn-helix transcriptional regulator [Clostridia bacterium]